MRNLTALFVAAAVVFNIGCGARKIQKRDGQKMWSVCSLPASQKDKAEICAAQKAVENALPYIFPCAKITSEKTNVKNRIIANCKHYLEEFAITHEGGAGDALEVKAKSYVDVRKISSFCEASGGMTIKPGYDTEIKLTLNNFGGLEGFYKWSLELGRLPFIGGFYLESYNSDTAVFRVFTKNINGEILAGLIMKENALNATAREIYREAIVFDMGL